MQLENRFGNMKRKKRVGERDDEDDPPNKKSKKSPANEYGCIAWQPSIPESETSASLEVKRQEIMDLYHSGPNKWTTDSEKISNLMGETYTLQRIDINSGMKVSNILERWPFLGNVYFLNKHFEMLTGKDAVNSLKVYLNSSSEKLIKFFTSMSANVQQCLKIEREMLITESTTSQDSKLIAIICMLTASLKEDVDNIFCKVEEDIVDKNLPDVVPDTPTIIIKGQSTFSAKEYKIAVDRVIIGSCTDAIGALAMLFSCYYAFNIKYSTETAGCLEYIQRIIMNINPVKGSKLGKKKGNRQWNFSPPLLTLLNSIKNFEELIK